MCVNTKDLYWQWVTNVVANYPGAKKSAIRKHLKAFEQEERFAFVEQTLQELEEAGMIIESADHRYYLA